MESLADKSTLSVTSACMLAGMVCILLAISAESATAQPAAAITLAAGANDPATVQDLEALAAKIESDQGREQLLGQIRALIALQNQKTPAMARRPFSERLAEAVSETLQETYRRLSSIGRYVPDREALANWFEENLLRPQALSQLSSQALPIVLILAMAWLSEFIVGRLLGRFRRRIEARADGTSIAPVGPALARVVLRFCALGVFAIVAFSAFFFLRPGPPGGDIAVQIFAVYICGRILVILTRMVLAPSAASLRLVPLSSESALTLFSWIRRLIIVALIGYLAGGTALLFGLSVKGFSYLMDLLGMILLVLVIACILQNRKAVACWIRGVDEGPPGLQPFSRRFRRRLAAVWHMLAIVYLIGVFVIWWQEIEGGFFYLVRATLLSAFLLFAARLAIQGLRGGFVQKITASDWLGEKFPILAQRLKRYAPIVFFILRAVITLVATITILEAWKVDVIRWLVQPFVRQFLAFFVSMLLVAVIAAAIWETVHIATEHYLAKSEKFEHTPGHGARVRTLLPLIRKALMIALSVMVVMMVLSELGLNIGPLLAGAGIIGLAVGFGAQKLVQDIITGVFILLEDAIAVGDVVKVAGIGGLVEDLSIRSIRLRDLSGNVHTIPFSSVDTVTNMTRLYAYYVADIGVAYREDTDKVAEVCRQIVDDMRADPQFGPQITEPLEVLGVDQFADSAVIIKVRIKTRPIQQWSVGREFNRRMKKRFDELGIEIPFPHRTLYFGAGKDERAATAHVGVEQT